MTFSIFSYDIVYNTYVDELLNVAQAAELAGMSERNLGRYLAREKEEPGRHVPGAARDEQGRWRIPKESAQALGKYAPPLTTEEKGLIAVLKAIDEKTTAKEITREINKTRAGRGAQPIKKHSVDKFLMRMRVREQVEGDDAEYWLVDFLKAMQSPEFAYSLQTSPRDALSMLDLKGLPTDAQREVRRMVELTLNHMRLDAALPEQVLSEDALKHLLPAEEALIRGQLQGLAEGMQAGMEAGLVGGVNYQARKLIRESHEG